MYIPMSAITALGVVFMLLGILIFHFTNRLVHLSREHDKLLRRLNPHLDYYYYDIKERCSDDYDVKERCSDDSKVDNSPK